MMQTVLKKQWMDMQGRLWTYPLVAFCLTLASDNPVPILVAAAFLAMDLATQTAGDDARHGTFEFIFTRAIDRRAYLRTKFLFGPPTLIGFILFAVLLEAMDARSIFRNLVMEPLEPEAAGVPLSAGAVLVTAAAIVFLFSVVFSLVNTATSEASFFNLNFLGLIIVIAYGGTVVFLYPFLLGLFEVSLPDLMGRPSFALFATAAFLVPSAILYFISREVYARRMLPPPVVRGGGRNSTFAWVGLIVFILLVLVFFMFALLHVAPAPSAP